MEGRMPARPVREIYLPEKFKDFVMDSAMRFNKPRSNGTLPCASLPDLTNVNLEDVGKDVKHGLITHSLRGSRASVVSGFSDIQAAELERRKHEMELEEMRNCMLEDELRDRELRRIEEEVRGAELAAESVVMEARRKADEANRQATYKRDLLIANLERQRQLRSAEKQLKEAKIVEIMASGLKLDDTKPASAPMTTENTVTFGTLPKVPVKLEYSAEEPTHSTKDTHSELCAEANPFEPINMFPTNTRASQDPSMQLLISSSYGIPKPTLPVFNSGKGRDFVLLKMALDNLINVHPHLTEHYKYQVLLDRLGGNTRRLAEAYMHYPNPYTSALHALQEKYGQPRQLVQAEIGTIMNLMPVRFNDNNALDNFALSVHSLVGMLQAVEGDDGYELKCGSHVDQLLGKLPFSLRDGFIEHCLSKSIITTDSGQSYSLIDFDNWLQMKARAKRISSQAATISQNDFHKPQRREKFPNHFQSQSRPTPTAVFSTSGSNQTTWKPRANQRTSLITTQRSDTLRTGRAPPYCPKCNNTEHFLHNCPGIKSMTVEQIVEWIKSDSRCHKCGRLHKPENCTLKAPCRTCQGLHLTVMHDAIQRVTDSVYNISTPTSEIYIDQPARPQSVFLKLVKVLLHGPNSSMETFALLDDGSMRTMITTPAVNQLQLPSKPDSILITTIRSEPSYCDGHSVDLCISPVDRPSEKHKISGAFTADHLCLSEYTYPVKDLQELWPHLNRVSLSPINKAQPVILIGSDNAELLLPREPIQFGPPGTPVAICTALGWSLQGPSNDLLPCDRVQSCYFTVESTMKSELLTNVKKLWQIDVLPYSEKQVTRSKQDCEAVDILQRKTVRVDIDGVQRYATPLLRPKTGPTFHSTEEAVLPTLKRTERYLSHHPDLATVHEEQIDKLVKAGFVKIISKEETEQATESWYVPHHVVEHNGKHRLVFNCSFEHKGLILNKHLLPGPTLGPTLLGVLLRFRQQRVAISGDIQAMFHQIRLLPEDKPLLRFIWRNLNQDRPPDTYEWQVLPFGTTSSPCCATFALQKHVSSSDGNDDVVRSVNEAFYVDNCLDSVEDPQQGKSLVMTLLENLALGGFNIRQWASNYPSVLEDLPIEARSDSCDLWLNLGTGDSSEPTLGLKWKCDQDELRYKSRPIEYQQLNMRIVYKILASQYDPIGYLAPYLARAKMIIQDLWKTNRDWNSPIESGPLNDQWLQWESELVELKNVKLSRCYTSVHYFAEPIDRQIHVFCDASERIYGSVAYLRTTYADGSVHVSFIAARSRVAPKRQLSIPRLELSAALTGAQLADLIQRELTLPIHKVAFWSDSTTVLSWLKSDSCRFKVFVGTRVTEIQNLTSVESWNYVQTAENPADDITRGKSLKELCCKSRWQKGPDFLWKSPKQWPSQSVKSDTSDQIELKKTFCGMISLEPSIKLDFEHYQNWDSLLSSVVSHLYGAANSQDENTNKYDIAERRLFRQVQIDCFTEEFSALSKGREIATSSKLLQLSPEYDTEMGLIRVGGRLRQSELRFEEKNQIILDSHHPITKLLIKHYDDKLLHYGSERILAEIRRKFWIPRGREAIRRHQHHCSECRRWRASPNVPKMSNLPLSRLRIHKPVFYSTGVDCFGPMTVKVGRHSEKRWGVIFKCMTTRAVHLDLLDSMDTDTFLMAFRRFVSRRGKPFEMLSDCGTNFKGVETEIQQAYSLMEPALIERLGEQQVKWRFNPPLSPHFGGVWEREIKSVKHGLRVALGDQTVTEPVLLTVLIEVEGILNSKPLGYVSSNAKDINPVTPNLLLMGRLDASLPQVVYPVSELLGRRRWRHSQILAEHFWNHFLRYYLPNLQLRQKWNKEVGEIKCGDVVLAVDPQLPRAQWPVGRVLETFSGEDGRIRTARLDINGKDFIRSVVRLIQLPNYDDD